MDYIGPVNAIWAKRPTQASMKQWAINSDDDDDVTVDTAYPEAVYVHIDTYAYWDKTQ